MDLFIIQQMILQYTDTKEAIRSDVLWNKCGKPRKNNFYDILHNMEKNEWVRRTKEGIVRHDFSKRDFLMDNDDYLKEWSVNARDDIAKKHKPLFKITKNGKYYLTKSAQEDLYQYFSECDFNTLNTHNRNFLAYRLQLITPHEYRKNNKKFEELFDYMFNGLISDHKSFKKQITDHYLIAIHQTKFIV